MRLSSLRLFGFKTFAQATTLTFDADVVAIVGPNGSGKSNLVDAIRWVLGEQSSKSLRSQRTEDVIFAGNTRRRPLGLAEVTLTFDNRDGGIPLPYPEVAISRRAYRGGDIEYYINKERVRLRDVHELLMGTGLGPGSYAIVSQGQIDSILTSKPSERRALFEETSGVTKFLTRKAEALRRLEGASANAVRLHDLVREVETRLPELEAQVRRAERYRSLSRRVEELEVVFAFRATASRRAALESAQGRVAQALEARQAASMQLTELDRRLEQERRLAVESERCVEHARGECEAVTAVVAALERDVATARSRLAAREAYRDGAGEEAARRRAERERLSMRLVQLEGELSPLQESVTQLIAVVEEAERALQTERAATEALAVEHRQRDLAARTLVAEARAAITARAGIEREQGHLRDELTRYAGERLALERDLAHAESELLSVRDDEQRLSVELTGLEAALTACEAEVGATELRLAQAQQRLRESLHGIASVESRLQTLEELEATLEGHVPGTRAVIEASAAGRLSGIVGVVSSLVHVEESYARALDVAFGAGVSNIVTEHAHAAETAIEYLRSRELGRATFLPLDLMADRVGRELSPHLRLPGVIAYAHELVATEVAYRGVVAFLVGRTLVVDTLQTGVRLARERGFRDTVVTLEGDQLLGGGALSGGRSRRGERSILVRAAQVRQLREVELPALREALADAEADLAQAATETKRQAELREETRRRLQMLAARRREVTLHGQAQQKTTEQAQSRLAYLRQHDERLQAQIREVEERLAALPVYETHVLESDETVVGLELEVRRRREELQRRETAIVASRREATQARERLAAALAERDAARTQCEHLQHEEERVAGLDRATEEEIAALRARVTQCEAAFAEASQGLVERQEALRLSLTARQASSQRVLEAEREAQAARQHEREILEAGEADRRRVAELEAELALLNEQQTRLLVDADRIVEIGERYRDASDATLDELPRLREQLARFANVNLNAEVDREELLTRQRELQSQLDDVGRAREMLLAGIADLDASCESQFLATFTAVAEAFSATYTELFPEGEARMWLSEPEKPNESGIEISIRPPGKRMTSLTALSGGERAMTAVALIFALIRVKPSPFYLLDEIDAALDEMNVERFSHLVRQLASEAQLVMVTHNKKTMELAQRMYGITMAEPGVSTVVTAALDQELVTA